MDDIELLTRAAVAIRKDKAIEEDLGHISKRDYETWMCLADWLSACASVMAVAAAKHKGNAINLARVYLEEIESSD